MDRRLLDYSPETEAFEAGAVERGESELSDATSAGEVFGEADEMELAATLLEVTSETELDRYLGTLIDRAGGAVGSLARSPAGRALTGVLKQSASHALPAVGRAIGHRFGGAAGADIGSQVAQSAGKAFGLELEGLSPEDQEFEAAKSFVRFAGEAARNAAGAPAAMPPEAAAQAAVVRAARRYAPGLLSPASSIGAAGPRSPDLGSPGPGSPEPSARAIAARAVPASSGRWVRRGRSIVVVDS